MTYLRCCGRQEYEGACSNECRILSKVKTVKTLASLLVGMGATNSAPHAYAGMGSAHLRRYLNELQVVLAATLRTTALSCSNGSKIRPKAASEIPTPWSAIEISTYSSSSRPSTVMEPRAVNLHAFVNCQHMVSVLRYRQAIS